MTPTLYREFMVGAQNGDDLDVHRVSGFQSSDWGRKDLEGKREKKKKKKNEL